MDLLVSHQKARFAMKRSLNNIDMDEFIADLCIVNDRLLSKNFGDTNEIVCTFNTSLHKLLDKHAPLKKIRIRTSHTLGTIKRLRVRECIGASVRLCGDSEVSILREHCTQLLVIMSISS